MKKTCSICKKKKDLSEFYKKKTHKDGLASECIGCKKKRAKDLKDKWSPEKIKQERKNNTKRTRERRSKFSPEKKAEERKKNTKQVMDRINRMNPEQRELHKERVREYVKNLSPEEKERRKERHRKYGKTKKGKDSYKMSSWKAAGININIDEYDKKLKKQKNNCAICGRNKSELSRMLAVDHDHRAGTVRGLVCGRCNTLIMAVENHKKEVVKYLKKWDG